MILSITLNPCVDRVLFVDAFNPNDTNRVLRSETDAGGKGINAARIVAELGVAVTATGFLAGGTGDLIWGVLGEYEAVDPDFIVVPGETRLNISVEDGTGKAPTTLNEQGPTISNEKFGALTELIYKNLAGKRFVVAGGSLPPGIHDDVYADLIRFTRDQSVPMAVDADGESLRLALEAKPYLVKPNADETERLLGDEPKTLQEAVRAAERIREMGAEVAIVSMGAKGAALAAEGVALIAEAPKVEAKSTIGAGDSMVGGFLAGSCWGLTLEDAFRLGAAAGAATALTDGSEIGHLEVIKSLQHKVIIHKV